MASDMSTYPESLWHEQLPARAPRARLDQASTQTDVIIVGAGFTGLWTAYHLSLIAPDLDVTVIEAELVGFGASGRNGGWCIAELAADQARWTALSDAAGAAALDRAMHDTVDSIESIVATHKIDCDFVRGGEIHLARNGGQTPRLKALANGSTSFWLGAEEASDKCGATNVLGGLFVPSTAVLHPAKLVTSLADIVEAAGVHVYEQTRATAVEPGKVTTSDGVITATHVVLATEGYTAAIDGYRRSVAPLSTMMVATEPLSDDMLREVRLDDRTTFTDGRFHVIYGQRTADDRLAFGGRCAPYKYGSKIPPNEWYQTFDSIAHSLVDLFPSVADAKITHQWGGVMGLPRNWTPSVNLDTSNRFYRAGGYVGEGVAATELAGRTMALAIAGIDDPVLHLPWVREPSRKWPIEPFRWVGIELGGRLFGLADKLEARTDKPVGWATKISKVLRR